MKQGIGIGKMGGGFAPDNPRSGMVTPSPQETAPPSQPQPAYHVLRAESARSWPRNANGYGDDLWGADARINEEVWSVGYG